MDHYRAWMDGLLHGMERREKSESSLTPGSGWHRVHWLLGAPPHNPFTALAAHWGLKVCMGGNREEVEN